MQHILERLREGVRDATRVRVCGAHTKQTRIDGATELDTTKLRGVIDYQPTEYIIQAYAGTPVREIAAMLAEHGQYLPFDPLLVEHGATLGGTVATNASGPERYRYGGVRDFIVGCHYIDGMGELLSGGGKVVKNAAGFDYPKLFVGSQGALGVLTDVCFKVFPRPEVYNTLRIPFRNIESALDAMTKIALAPLDIHALDVSASSTDYALEIRVGGLQNGIAARMARIQSMACAGDVLSDTADAAHWRNVRELNWYNARNTLVKVPTTLAAIRLHDVRWREFGLRRYSVSGNVAWIEVPPGALDRLSTDLAQNQLAGQAFAGPGALRPLGLQRANVFAERVRAVLDPQGKFTRLDAQTA
jgi:glycolate oxidase FAD binding subunit